jgi:hypothetical protein
VTDAHNQAFTFSRRALLAAPLMLASAAKAVEPTLADDVASYVRFGEHRVGTATERKTAAWLKSRLSALGYQAHTEAFPVRTIQHPRGQLAFGNEKIGLFPQWFPPVASLGKSIAAPMVAHDAPGAGPAIHVMIKPVPLAPNWTGPLDDMVRDAAAKGALALVMAFDDPSNDLFVANQHHMKPLPIPVALLAKHNLATVAKAAGQQATFRLDGKLVDTKGLNVIGAKPGRGKMIVVSTPLTGWFHCGGERGPGIALWLRMAAFLGKQERPVLMLGTGSHEVGHLGMEYALVHNAPKPDEVALWLHFGASLAASRLDGLYGSKTQQYLVGTAKSAESAKAALLSAMPFYVPGNKQTLGEAGQIIGAGHESFVGLSGIFPTFHTPLDKSEAVDYAKLDLIRQGAEALIKSVL